MDSNHRKDIWNLPNVLSITRIGFAPVLVLVLLSPGKSLSLVAAFIFLLICLTDWLDGYLARKMGDITSLGKFLDPLADKLLIMTAFIMLIPLGRVPAWMIAFIVSREIAVTGLRTVAADRGIVIAASWAGKTKTVAQICAIVPLLVHYPFYGLDFQQVGTGLLWVAFVLTILSGVEYFVKFFKGGFAGGEIIKE
jgi:CDP-diacylglycerol--glycerol-3-phosphate 3-phosphatidyltransferase